MIKQRVIQQRVIQQRVIQRRVIQQRVIQQRVIQQRVIQQRVILRGVARGGSGGPWPAIPKEMWMVGNGGPITGCLIHIVTKLRGYKDACVRFSFTVLSFHKEFVIIQIGLS